MEKQSNEAPFRLSRRSFLKATGALGATAAFCAAGPGLLPVGGVPTRVLAAEGGEEIIPSVCAGCHNCCPMEVVVKNGAVVRAQGVAGNERTDGTLCARGLAAPQIAHDPRRLRYPMRRTGERGSGRFERITWDQALEELSGKIQAAIDESGPWSVQLCRGQAPMWGFPYDMLQRLTHAIGVEVFMGGSECFIPRAIGEAMTYGGLPLLHDYPNADLMIFWGRQPAFSGATLARKIFDARDRGAKLVVVDPLHFHLGANADQFIQIEPGTDMAMMLAMLYTIVDNGLWNFEMVDTYTNDPGLKGLTAHLRGENRLGQAFTPEWAQEITGVDAETIRSLAIEYATTPKACIVPGHGLEGRVNVSQTTRALGLLRLITAHIDAPGSDVMTLPGPLRNPDFWLEGNVVEGYKRTDPVALFAVPPYNPAESTYPLEFMMQGQISTPDTFRMMDEGKVKVCAWMGSNPMVMLAQPKSVKESLSKVDYVVSIDLYLNETGMVSDLLLPAATYLERTEPEWFKWDYWTSTVRLRRQAVTVGEAWPDSKIIIELGRRLGLDEAFPSEDVTWYIDELLKTADITTQKLLDTPEGFQIAPIVYRKYEQTGFSLPGGKAHVRAEILEANGFDAYPTWIDNAESRRSAPDTAKDYPLIAFTGRAGPMYVHCQRRTIPWLRELRPDPLLWIHPTTAAEYGIADGDLCVVESPRGSIQIKAELTSIIKPGTIYVPGGWPQANYNELGIEDQIDPISSQANYMTCLARVKKA